MLLTHSALPSPDGLISTMRGEDGECFGFTRERVSPRMLQDGFEETSNAPGAHARDRAERPESCGALGACCRCRCTIPCILPIPEATGRACGPWGMRPRNL